MVTSGVVAANNDMFTCSFANIELLGGQPSRAQLSCRKVFAEGLNLAQFCAYTASHMAQPIPS